MDLASATLASLTSAIVQRGFLLRLPGSLSRIQEWVTGLSVPSEMPALAPTSTTAEDRDSCVPLKNTVWNLNILPIPWKYWNHPPHACLFTNCIHRNKWQLHSSSCIKLAQNLMSSLTHLLYSYLIFDYPKSPGRSTARTHPITSPHLSILSWSNTSSLCRVLP